MAGEYVPCTNNSCRFPTRSSRQTSAEHPGTRLRRRGGLCATCFNAENQQVIPRPAPKPESPSPRPETLRGLGTFMAARCEREAVRQRRANPGRFA
jgi:hypothetical protein